MNDAELRALVRGAVRRHLGDRAPAVSAAAPAMPILTEPPADPGWRQHASHVQYLTLVNVGDACLIEPSVECNHCGYCKSHGH